MMMMTYPSRTEPWVRQVSQKVASDRFGHSLVRFFTILLNQRRDRTRRCFWKVMNLLRCARHFDSQNIARGTISDRTTESHSNSVFESSKLKSQFQIKISRNLIKIEERNRRKKRFEFYPNERFAALFERAIAITKSYQRFFFFAPVSDKRIYAHRYLFLI